MRKVYSILIALSLVISLGGCSASGSVSGPVYINPELTHFTTLDEIIAFADTGNLPDEFVSFDALSILGDFDNYLVFTHDYDMYMYNMIDEKGFHFSVYIRHCGFVRPKKILWKSRKMVNMLETGTDETGWLPRDKIVYLYRSGKLGGIYLYIDGLQVAITFMGGMRIEDYPVGTDGNDSTFIERIVFGTRKEALAAADEFIEYFRANR